MSERELTKQNSKDPTVQSLLDELRPILKGITKASIRDVGIYGCVLRASVAKSFEFAELVYRDPSPEHGFFMTSTLRGICEDLIVLSFVAALSPAKRNEAMSLLMAKISPMVSLHRASSSSQIVLGSLYCSRLRIHPQTLKNG